MHSTVYSAVKMSPTEHKARDIFYWCVPDVMDTGFPIMGNVDPMEL